MRKTTRRTISGIFIAIGSLTILAMYYDITLRTLAGLLLGSVLLVAAMMVGAVLLLLAAKLLLTGWNRLRGQKDD